MNRRHRRENRPNAHLAIELFIGQLALLLLPARLAVLLAHAPCLLRVLVHAQVDDAVLQLEVQERGQQARREKHRLVLGQLAQQPHDLDGHLPGHVRLEDRLDGGGDLGRDRLSLLVIDERHQLRDNVLGIVKVRHAREQAGERGRGGGGDAQAGLLALLGGHDARRLLERDAAAGQRAPLLLHALGERALGAARRLWHARLAVAVAVSLTVARLRGRG